jgi:Fe-S oxidoreductase
LNTTNKQIRFGQPSYNTDYQDDLIVKKNIDFFIKYDYVAVPSNSSLSLVKIDYPKFYFDNHYKELSTELSMKILKFSVFNEHHSKCYGFGGSFSVKFSGFSNSMCNDKADEIIKTGADYIVTNNNSYHIQTQDILIKMNLRIIAIRFDKLLAEKL